jgi:hypothetical protein
VSKSTSLESDIAVEAIKEAVCQMGEPAYADTVVKEKMKQTIKPNKAEK